MAERTDQHVTTSSFTESESESATLDLKDHLIEIDPRSHLEVADTKHR
jgi:hypothetical protein